MENIVHFEFLLKFVLLLDFQTHQELDMYPWDSNCKYLWCLTFFYKLVKHFYNTKIFNVRDLSLCKGSEYNGCVITTNFKTGDIKRSANLPLNYSRMGLTLDHYRFVLFERLCMLLHIQPRDDLCCLISQFVI